MTKKVFLSTQRAIQPVQNPSVKRYEIASTSRNNPFSEQLNFMIFDETSNFFPKYNATWRRLLIKINYLLKSKTPVLI